MSPEDIKKLLGGYATGTLTTEEQQALFAAALEDQELFDSLAREQSLRDLLRDPAARAGLLSALDTPASRLGGFWQWLRRPLVAGLATAGVAAIAVVAVWQGTRPAGVKLAQPVIVAELRSPEPPAPNLAPALPPPPAGQPEAKVRSNAAEEGAAVMADKKAPPPAGPFASGTGAAANADAPAAAVAKDVTPTAARPPASPAQAMPADATALALAKEKATPVMAPPPPPPPASVTAPVMARKAEAESAAPGQAAAIGAMTRAVSGTVPLDARALFYANQLAPGANAFVQPGGGGGAAPPPVRPEESRADAAPRTAKVLSGLAAPIAATPLRLGVRVSILRGAAEVDLTTVLDPGETVRLKLTPNADGFLYVAEGERMVASGAAQRLQPFETPELRFQGSGQKQLTVIFSRRPQTVAPLSLRSLARDNLVENSVDRERATYVVSGPRDAAAPQVVVPVTLTYR